MGDRHAFNVWDAASLEIGRRNDGMVPDFPHLLDLLHGPTIVFSSNAVAESRAARLNCTSYCHLFGSSKDDDGVVSLVW